jgi:hypothetical protein
VLHQNQVFLDHHPLFIHYIYTFYQSSQQPIYNYKGLWIRYITIPSPLFMNYRRCIIYTYTYKISNIIKKMRIFCMHSILALPGCILRTVPNILDLYHLHGSIMELLYFSIQYENRSHLKSSFGIHLKHIPINDMISIKYILLKK